MENSNRERKVGDFESGFFCQDLVHVLRGASLAGEVPAKFEPQSASVVAETGDDADEAPGAALHGGAHGAVVQLAVVLFEAAEGVGGVSDVVEARVEGIERGKEIDAVNAEIDGGHIKIKDTIFQIFE